MSEHLQIKTTPESRKAARTARQPANRKVVPRKPPTFENSTTTLDFSHWVTDYNHTAYVVGGGPSLTNFNWEVLNDKFVVGINRAYEVLPDAQIIYFTDDDWYKTHKANLLRHKGLNIKGSLNTSTLGQDKNLYQYHLTGEHGLEETPGCLRHGRNSTYAVCNMLAQMGFKTIFLLGIDMKWQRNQKGKKTHQTHWHDGHKRIDAEGLYKSLIQNFNKLAPLLQGKGVEVINVNNASDLPSFPKKTYEEVFGPNWKKY